MTIEDLLKDLDKLKLQPNQLYLLALRQVLLNQSELLTKASGGGRCHQYANDSVKLVKRIDEFIENKE